MRIRRALAVSAILLMSAAEALATGRVALVIGNAAYQHVVPLANTVNDAEQMARMLKAAGFEVQHHRDLPLADFRKAVRDFADRSQSADYALVFFAGHGIEIDGAPRALVRAIGHTPLDGSEPSPPARLKALQVSRAAHRAIHCPADDALR